MTSLSSVILSPSALSGPQGLAPRRGRISILVARWLASLKMTHYPAISQKPKAALKLIDSRQNAFTIEHRPLPLNYSRTLANLSKALYTTFHIVLAGAGAQFFRQPEKLTQIVVATAVLAIFILVVALAVDLWSENLEKREKKPDG